MVYFFRKDVNRMTYKKWLAVLLSVLFLFCTTACTDESSDTHRDKASSTTITTTIATTTTTAATTATTATSTIASSATKATTTTVTTIITTTTTSSPKDEVSASPLLYRVTDADGDVVWLFGSIHVGKKAFYPLPNYITDALKGSDGLAVEFDIINFESNLSAQTAALSKLVYTDDSTIRDHLSEEVYQKAVSVLKELNIYNKMYDYYMPALWSSLIDSSLLDPEAVSLGIDRHMIEMAYELDLRVYDIESAKLQYGIMASFSDKLQETLLLSSMEGYNDTDTYVREVNALMDLWASGDAKALRTYLSSEGEEIPPEEEAIYKEYTTKMQTDRDKSMTAYVVDALNRGKELFVCVGAAHVVGKGAMIDQLLADGYVVELVN